MNVKPQSELDEERRALALTLSVENYKGWRNTSEDILKTAVRFETYIKSGETGIYKPK